MDAKKGLFKGILGDLKAEKAAKKQRVNLYLTTSIYEAFRRVCADLPASTVMDRLMERFIESQNPSKKGEK